MEAGIANGRMYFFPDWHIVGLFIIQEMMAMGRLYWWYKAHNICTQCRKEEAVPEPFALNALKKAVPVLLNVERQSVMK